jgi:pyruvate, orthophosphate dikinase
MKWIHRLSADVDQTADVIGGKAAGLVVLQRLGLPVPPGFVIVTDACRAFLRDGHSPGGLDEELAAAVADLEAATGVRGSTGPLPVSVRSGGRVSMPGMMRTILNVEGTPAAVGRAVEAVFASWETPRARTYRELNEIPHDLGTAVVVQAMVFGDRDERSGSGVAFSRDPNTGEHVPYGEVLFGHRGEDVVAGTALTRPLQDLADREPTVWAGLLHALGRVEDHHRDACSLEFTYESGELWLLQLRRGRFVGGAAVRVAVDLAEAGRIERSEALLRVSTLDLRQARTPRLGAVGEADVLTRGLGACPGVATGRVATTSDRAARMAADGPVILVRPQTSPLDMHGLAAAAGVVTARGGPTSHAAVVARSMGKPAVVSAADLTVDDAGVRVGGRTVPEGTILTIDGTSGEVVLGTARVAAATDDPAVRRLLTWADEVSDGAPGRDGVERLEAAHAALHAAGRAAARDARR